MGLNLSKGNMYNWLTHTWNAVKGACPHDCSYCYMRVWGVQKPLRLDEKEFKTDLGSGNFIFVGSSCDMFASEIPLAYIEKTLAHCSKFPGNRYLFQSKNPLGFTRVRHLLPKATALCVTIETNRVYDKFMGKTPSPLERARTMVLFENFPKYVTVEPIMDFDIPAMTEYIKHCGPEQVNIGADSGGNNLPEPPAEKIHFLIDELTKFTKVVLKPNLKRIYF